MGLADDLLLLSQDLLNLRLDQGDQASLRRAVSTAYYAFFHLLVSEATSNWDKRNLRPLLGRCFEHGRMKSAAEKVISDLKNPSAADDVVAVQLRAVAGLFMQAQQNREDADYDTSKEWTQIEVYVAIESVRAAFGSWYEIRDEDLAQAFLVRLLGPRERRARGNP
jgi:uncharacterized protein (UPF0332 family)